MKFSRFSILLLVLVFLTSLLHLGSEVQAATTITFTGEELLGKPEDTSITVNVIPNSTIEYHYQYGTASGVYTMQTPDITATGGQPSEIVIGSITPLTPNTHYYYRMQYHLPGETDWVERDEHSFWTQRAEGSAFTFTITSDSHMNGGGGNESLYVQTLNNVAADHPDLHFDLGDTFWMDDVTTSTVAKQRYLNQREWMSVISHSAAIFVATGNHENEEGWNFDDTPSKALLSIEARKLYYPNPVTDGFYTGNTDPLPEEIGGDYLREDYYAWEWGDALFVVIDPFQYTMTKPYSGTAGGEDDDETVSNDVWDWTLGEQQYQWFKQTLENSDTTFKFVFSHHVTGGIEPYYYVRGGAEAVPYYEWGGYNWDGVWEFDTERPAWETPIHQLMVDNGVSAFFHGHDHEYAYEERDGIVYQLVPSPSMTGYGFGLYDEDDPYTIRVLPNSGHLRVTVSPTQATVDYVSTSSGTVNYSYTILPNDSTDTTPPYTSGHNPADAATGVAVDTNIVVHVLDDGEGVDNSTIVMTVEGTPVIPVITGTATDYTLTYDPPTDFDYLQEVNVTVDASDLAILPNAMTTEAYSFTIQEEAAPSPITYVGDIGTATSKTSGTTLVITTTADVAAGGDIIVVCITDPYSGLTVTVTDSAGNTYTQAVFTVNTGNLRAYIFYSCNVTALPSGGTITITTSNAVTAKAAVASVFSGLADVNPVDQTHTGTGSGTTPTSGATSTTLYADELLIGAVGTEGPVGDDAGSWLNDFTAGPRDGTTGGTNDTNITASLGWQIVSATGAYTAQKSGIISRDWATMIATFKSEAAGPTPPSFNIILGRPTDTSVTANIIPNQDGDAYIEYGTESGVYGSQTSTFSCTADEPVEVVIDGLSANAEYYYRLRFQATGETTWTEGDEYSFHTQRASGETFTFTIIADSHLGQYGGNTADEKDLYEQALLNAQADNPDFHIDLGDMSAMDPSPLGTGMTVEEADAAYYIQRPYMGLIGSLIPIFLVLGNHENEEGWNWDDTFAAPDQSLAIVGIEARKKYFPNPVPDGSFYTGNTDPLPEEIGGDYNREDYYAWEWGDVLFVVLDPFHYSMTWPNDEGTGYGGEGQDGEVSGDRWDWTLGIEQYLWFKDVLETSDATYKFVFSHHVTGGATPYGRGGISAAPYFEWGGYNADGTWGWDTERPAAEGWDAPIHQLMVENGVNIFFHGHDHIYAYEELDGIVYTECPKPDDAGYAWEPYGYGYTENLYPDGLVIPNSGHIRVTVSPTEVTVDYVRAYLPGDGTNGQVAHSYTILPNTTNNPPVASNQSVTTDEDTAKTITLSASDADGDPLTYSIVTPPTHGSLSGTPPNVTYTPAANYNGPDSFTFKANDGKVDSNTGTVSITVNAVTITVNDFANYQVLQRDIGGTSKSVTVSGNYINMDWSRVEARVLQHGTNTTVVDWAIIDNTPGGGTFSGNITVPQGGWYNIEVRALDNAGSVIDSNRGTNKWGVGMIILCIGQSNMSGHGEQPFTIANSDLAVNYSNAGIWEHLADPYDDDSPAGAVDNDNTTASGSMIPALANSLLQTFNFPIAFIPSAKDGTNLYSQWVYRNSSNHYDTTTLYGQSITKVQNAGGVELIIMHQGEADTNDHRTEAQYEADFTTLINNYREDIYANIPIFICQLGTITLGTNTRTDADVQAVRNAQHDLDNGVNIFMASTAMDQPRLDAVHYTSSGLDAIGERMAQAIKYYLGTASYYRGPAITSATFTGNRSTIDVQIAHRGGSDFMPTSGITGFSVLINGSSVDINSAVRISADRIRLTLASAAPQGALVTLRYLWGSDPVTTALVKDNSSLALPLENTTIDVTVTEGGILGDVNGDDTVNSTDALIILSYDVGIDTSPYNPMSYGDVNDDGLVNSTDALIILSYDVGIDVPYPVGEPV